MSGVGFLSAIVIGLLAGWIAEKMSSRDDGLIMNLIIGLLGAVLGGFIASLFGIGYSGFFASLIVSVLGAMLLLFILGAIRRKA